MIPVNQPLFAGNEAKYLQECIASGWLSGDGPFVERFEREFAAYIGRRHAIAVNSGTAALDLSVEALGIGPGDEVILPTFTIISCVNQILRAGAHPVFVDCDPLTWNMDVRQIRDKITPRTRAIMPVHIYGLPVDMDPVLALAQEFDLRIIEDAAEAHGLTYKGKKCGSFGDVSTFSFYANKNITTGEGGMILTDDSDLAARCRSLRNLCFGSRRYVHERLGWGCRMSNMQAAVGVAQLERLPWTLIAKRGTGLLYNEGLSGIGLQLPQIETSYAINGYWVYPVVHPSLWAGTVRELLADRGIATRPFFYPLHLQPMLRLQCAGLRFPVAELAALYGFYLPSGAGITDAQIDQVVKAVKEIMT